MKKNYVDGSRCDVEIKKRADASIAHGALTNSKRPECFVNGFYPTHVTGGHGVHLQDTGNRLYIEFVCGLGSNLLGYGNTLTTNAAIEAARRGVTHSLSSVVEVDLAEKIKEIMPFVEKVRFLKSGSEGCIASVKIARAFTGRKHVISEGYHGWHDEFVSLTPPALGVPPHSFIKPYSPMVEIDESVAAVIIEPIMTELTDARINWLKELREKCTKSGTLLIFDETITALRFPKFSVAGYLGIHPDLIVFGKALANGFPISCIGGRGDVMSADYFVSSTFAGDTVAISAAIATIKALQRSYDINHLWRTGLRFQERFNEMSPHVKIEGYPTRGVLKGDDMHKAIFMQEACRAGLLFGSSWFWAFPHIDLSDQIFNILKDVFLKIEIQKPQLAGDMPKKPIAQTIREKK
jgi:glutamate-1-semialdehyde aminotransferase